MNFNNGFDDIYLIEQDVDINELSLQYEEVQKVKWASKEEIFSVIDSGEFIPYYKSLIQLFFDARKNMVPSMKMSISCNLSDSNLYSS